jgi:hypothetical protein
MAPIRFPSLFADTRTTSTLAPGFAAASSNLEYQFGFDFLSIAENKYGQSVAGLLLPKSRGSGLVLLLPQFRDKESVIVDLLQTVLPEIRPKLFPDHEGERWVQRDEYEHSVVQDCRRRQVEIRRHAEAQVEAIEKEIEAERSRLGFMHGILTKQSSELVQDVRLALEFIGFRGVVNVDLEQGGGSQQAGRLANS